MSNGGKWTTARFNSFIKSALRGASMRWPPRNEVRKAARTERGKYRCAGWRRKSHIVPASLPPEGKNKRRINNVSIDHLHPVVEPGKEFSWDAVIKNLFCEADQLQVLCHECHKSKTQEERERRKHEKEK